MVKTPRKTQYIFANVNILKHLLKNRKIYLFLDYDGTLAPIAVTPDKALLSPDMGDVLTGLSGCSGCHLAVISGRTLADLKKMIHIPNITYAGSHGFEIEGTHLNFESLISLEYLADLTSIKEQLNAKLSSVEGIWLEDKGIIVTLHFRLTGEKGEYLAKEIFRTVCQSYVDQNRVKVTEGKKVLEVRPPIKWDKGEAVHWILSKWQMEKEKNQVVTIYLGDDNTDEDAFKMLDKKAVKVRVEESDRSFADYHLKNQQEVCIFLNTILTILNKPE